MRKKRIINLDGEQGNAGEILAIATKYLKQLYPSKRRYVLKKDGTMNKLNKVEEILELVCKDSYYFLLAMVNEMLGDFIELKTSNKEWIRLMEKEKKRFNKEINKLKL